MRDRVLEMCKKTRAKKCQQKKYFLEPKTTLEKWTYKQAKYVAPGQVKSLKQN